MTLRYFVGWDSDQMAACQVAQRSAQAHASIELDVRRLALSELQASGLYWRPTTVQGAGLWDEISEAPMSTGHAIGRFLVPALCGYDGLALFTDGDVLFRRDVADLLRVPPGKAVYVVQHNHRPLHNTKMDGQTQTLYHRKNWSSVVLFDAGHPANLRLTVEMVNALPGRDLHRFCWLADDEIGALDPAWNVLVGVEPHPDPAVAHFTDGLPYMPGHAADPWADEWRAVAARCGYRQYAEAAKAERA